ncbi:MAG TPA: ABC transporter ATP-binding protein, partial [Burkholderiales bacterium]|nr:ABC transporter ATP-binding protein [Burkholderiales bacterium]
MTEAPVLELRSVEHAYDAQAVVSNVSFALARGGIACILGPSGCGKTTLLRGIAGFEPVRAGEILIDAKVVSRPGYRLAPEHRRIGMVFQDYALFPHLTVRENVRFGLRALARRDSDARVAELAELVGIGEALDKYPHELSGGQQQRTALARALAPRPELLLLDEPFSNLDVDLRERLSLEVREIIKASGTTAVLVTHDQHEAFALADEIGVLHEGRIQQWDSAYNL